MDRFGWRARGVRLASEGGLGGAPPQRRWRSNRLRLQVRNYQSGAGQRVHVSHGDILENQVFARRVDGSYHHWRVGPKTKEGRAILADLRERLESNGVVRVDAGVLASAPSGGKLSHFRIKEFNEPTPALGALPH
jgi:hypothetical protein